MPSAPPPLRRILEAAALVALLDGAAAILLYVTILHQTTPIRLFQGIAASLLGRGAFDGGLPIALVGLLMHTGIALGWATVYAVLWSRWPALERLTATTRGALLAGVLYGPCVWFAMRFGLLPLTEARLLPVTSPIFPVMIGIHALVVGPPIALRVRR